MLKLSGLVIDIGKSRDYFLLLVIINVFTVLLCCALAVETKYVVGFSCILLLQLYKESKNKKPHSEIKNISYTGKHWSINLQNGNFKNYSKIKIRLYTGFFILIAFFDGSKIKNIVIFNDQISALHRRYIHIIAKL